MYLNVLLSIFGCQRTIILKPGRQSGGDNRVRTDDPRLAKPVLSQLSYIPIELPKKLVGLARFELATSRLSGVRSNQLSYRPNKPAAGPRSSLWQENSVRVPTILFYRNQIQARPGWLTP